MDGTKRKARSSSTSFGPLIDLGATPPWSLPATLYQESALRSTQITPPETTVDPVALHQHAASEPEPPPKASLPRNEGHLQARPQTRRGSVKHDFDVADADAADEDDDFHVDTENDGVYMINANEGSWSASLSSENDQAGQERLPEQAVLALRHLKRARELTKQQKCLKAANQAIEALLAGDENLTVTSEHKLKWQNDLLLQNTMRHIKKQLQQGARLNLERLGPVNFTMSCAHPLCPAEHRLMPLDSYYLILCQSCRDGTVSRYCLSCLEGLWNGEGMFGRLLDPAISDEKGEARKMIPSFGLDGTMDEARLMAAGITPTAWTPVPNMTMLPPTVMSGQTTLHTTLTPPTTCGSPSLRKSTHIRSVDNDESVALSESPLLRKSGLSIQRLEEQTEIPEVEELSLEPQAQMSSAKLLRAHQPLQTLPGRRSARLDTVNPTASSAPLVRVVASSALKQRDASSTRGKRASIDTVADEVRRADARLEAMYSERQHALAMLIPGERLMIRHPRDSSSKTKRFVSKDMLDVVYTDLLANPVKYWTKGQVADRYHVPEAVGSPGAVATPTAHKHAKQVRMSDIEERWCLCLGVEDGRAMIKCDNEKCLVGWYHIECVDADVDENDEWLCPLCCAHQAKNDAMPSSGIDDDRLNSLFATSFDDKPVYDLRNGKFIEQMASTLAKQFEPSLLDLQLDGPAEHPTLAHLPPKPSPLSQMYSQIPESLLSSKHAPSVAELSAYQVEQSARRTPTPPLDTLPETPGTPESSNESTDSQGEWRHPPTRFQHLVRFIKPGNSLNKAEGAAVKLWKAASGEQLNWDEFRERYRMTVQDLSKASGTEEDDLDVFDDDDFEEGSMAQWFRSEVDQVEGKKVESDVGRGQIETPQSNAFIEEQLDDKSLQESESTAGISKEQCRGRNLTAVLADVHARESEQAKY